MLPIAAHGRTREQRSSLGRGKTFLVRERKSRGSRSFLSSRMSGRQLALCLLNSLSCPYRSLSPSTISHHPLTPLPSSSSLSPSERAAPSRSRPAISTRQLDLAPPHYLSPPSRRFRLASLLSPLHLPSSSSWEYTSCSYHTTSSTVQPLRLLLPRRRFQHLIQSRRRALSYVSPSLHTSAAWSSSANALPSCLQCCRATSSSRSFSFHFPFAFAITTMCVLRRLETPA